MPLSQELHHTLSLESCFLWRLRKGIPNRLTFLCQQFVDNLTINLPVALKRGEHLFFPAIHGGKFLEFMLNPADVPFFVFGHFVENLSRFRIDIRAPRMFEITTL